RSDGRDLRPRLRPGDRRQRPRADLREVRPDRRPRDAGDRARTADLARARPAPRRRPDGRVEARSRQHIHGTPAPGRGLMASRVLVVDDMVETRRLMRRVLERARFTVNEAGTGEAALSAIRRDRPDAVVLDLRLPGISGFDVARAVRSDRD